MAAICRFGMRVVPNISEIIAQCRNKKQLVQGPHIAEFEQEFRRVLGGRGHVRAVSTEYGRMALYFILKALNIPAGSEIIVPALTFWVVPEITRVAGLKPVFADIDPNTFTLDPKAAERAITPNTRAILPTHLYGMACDMAPIVALARKHKEGDRGLCAFARRHLPGSPDRILRGRQLLQLPGVQAAQHIRWGPRMGAGRRC